MLWTVQDVCHWIQSFGENYSNYVNSFRKDVIDGYRLCSFIHNKALIKYGITNEVHRQKILDGIQQLKNDL
jgi:hypothetical protein